jgi:hypothetical protein
MPWRIENKSHGCPLAALISDLDRFQKDNAIPILDEYLKKFGCSLGDCGADQESTLALFALLALLVGALTLARSIQDGDLRERIIEQSLHAIENFSPRSNGK